MKLKLLVFDCDGVILDSAGVKVDAFAATGSLFDADVADWLLSAHKASPGLSRHVLFDRLYRIWYGRDILESERSLLNKVFRSSCRERLLQAPPIPGALETIAKWRDRVPVHVCSGSPQEDLDELFAARDLSSLFAGVHGSPPGKTELLASIVRDVGVLPEETVMVGDSITDLEAARCVKTHFYGCGEHMADQTRFWSRDLSNLDAWLCEQTSTHC